MLRRIIIYLKYSIFKIIWLKENLFIDFKSFHSYIIFKEVRFNPFGKIFINQSQCNKIRTLKSIKKLKFVTFPQNRRKFFGTMWHDTEQPLNVPQTTVCRYGHFAALSGVFYKWCRALDQCFSTFLGLRHTYLNKDVLRHT